MSARIKELQKPDSQDPNPAAVDVRSAVQIDADEVVQELRFQGHPALAEGDPQVHKSEGQLVRTAACPVCGNSLARSTYLIEGMDFQVVTCTDCQLGSLHPRPNLQEICSFYPAEYYGTPQAKFEPLIEYMVRLVAARNVRALTSGLPPASRILDVGCGRGVLLKGLADCGFETHGVEISESAAAGADPRAKIRIAPNLADAEYPPNHFDQVIVWHVLEHLPDPAGTLTEIRRILKPGGRIVVAVPNYSSWQSRWFGERWFHLDLPRHLYHFPFAALEKLLKQSGFSLRSTHHFSLRQNPFGWVQSALNGRFELARNSLYTLLHRRNPNTDQPYSLRTRRWLRIAYWLGMPLGLLCAVMAAFMRSGATIHLVAELGATEERGVGKLTDEIPCFAPQQMTQCQ